MGTTHLEEPYDNQAGCWAGQQLVAVLGHSGGGDLQGGGHWVAYRKVVGGGSNVVRLFHIYCQEPDHMGLRRWWCLDSTTAHVVERDPFALPHRPGRDPTLQLLIFKQ